MLNVIIFKLYGNLCANCLAHWSLTTKQIVVCKLLGSKSNVTEENVLIYYLQFYYRIIIIHVIINIQKTNRLSYSVSYP